MRQHHYRIIVEADAPAPPVSSDDGRRLTFSFACHDDALALVERIRQRGDFDESGAGTSAAFTVGLKLLGEVMLKHRNHPLFEEFGPQVGQFMKRIKGHADSRSSHEASAATGT
jgi:hypothetical protein